MTKIKAQGAPEKDDPKKSRDIIRTKVREMKMAPEKDNGFLKHTQKGKC